MSPFFSPDKLKGTLKLSLNFFSSNKGFWFTLINSKTVKISKSNSYSSNFPGIISNPVMSSLIYCPLFLKVSIPLDFAGWTEGRGWAGQKTRGVPSETAAQGRGGSAEEAAAGGWGGTEKGWSSVMMHRKKFISLYFQLRKLFHAECTDLVFAWQPQSWGGPDTERGGEGSARTHQAGISKKKTAANFGGARPWEAQIQAQKAQAKVGPSWGILQWFRHKVFFYT